MGLKDMMTAAEHIAKDKLKCTSCGSNDWHNFLFAGTEQEPFVAGCKRCGAGYQYDSSTKTWSQKSGPAPKPEGF